MAMRIFKNCDNHEDAWLKKHQKDGNTLFHWLPRDDGIRTEDLKYNKYDGTGSK
jgi:hypothetical protein